MKNEIKEILDRIEKASNIFDCLLKPEECTELLDYITNLQQENERLKIEWVLVKSALDTSQSKIGKAIEYNYKLQERYCHSALFDEPVASKIYEIAEKQLNILQGVGN